MKSLLLALALTIGGSALAANIEVYRFDNPKQEKIYKDLIGELRCLVCQNQNISDSNAELAQDMRRKTYELVKSGKDKSEVADFMAERYGDFVLYKPPFNATTALLWLGPFFMFALGIVFMLRTIKRRRSENEQAALSEGQLREAAELLKQKKDQ